MNQYKYTTRILGSAVGPLTSILLFYLIGNSWSMTELKTVFVSGLLVSIPSILMLSLFRDDKALGAESDIAHTNSYARLEEQETPVSTDENENGDYHLLENTTANNASPISYEDQDDAIVKSHSPSALYWVPRLLAFSDVVLALASGMTIKFFPLFFKEETLLAPIEVNVVFLTTSIGVAITSVLARIVAPRIGGVRTMIAFYIPGVLLLAGMYCMSIGYDIKNGSVPLWRNEWVIVPVFVLRTSLMNCTPPIKKAIFMEHVPIAKRGRWSAFESLTRFGWSGSAFIGGLCVDKYGYGATFLITACLQAIGVVAIGIVGFFIDQ
uniref:Major facilitator superfamily (MFS) profile domain-containing protein n=1 Tax=Aplanochytrium stocchinoi TaxID=215587 RepID=A0A7S3V2F7_9STRA